MSKQSNQRMKVLYLMRIMLQNTDEKHMISMGDIVEKLQLYGINAERKSLYDDLESLRTFGIDIIYQQGKNGGYYVASRDFELPELKLLVDAVQSSKFISLKKSNELIKKLESYASKYEASQLQRQVYVHKRIKSQNESIYYIIDDIHEAIFKNSKIKFKYCEWNINKEMQFKRNGEYYTVSPWALTWDDENYYLIAHEEGVLKHFRVDKISSVNIINEHREAASKFDNFDTADYVKKVFGMFGGKSENVTIKLPENMIGVVIDRFGTDVSIRRVSEGVISIHTKVEVSHQFFGWVTALGADVRIAAPSNVVEEYRQYIDKIRNQYE